MKKLSKKATFEMLKNEVITLKSVSEQKFLEECIANCETLHEFKKELSEAKHKYESLKEQQARGNYVLWYLGESIPNNAYMRMSVPIVLGALDSIAKVLGYKFKRHFLISIK